MKKYIPILVLFAALLISSCDKSEPEIESKPEEVNVYTHRHYDTDKLLFKQFEEETGIKVNVINANADELITRMENEGDQSPADVLITVDAGRLHKAKASGLLQPVESETLVENVPEHLKDAQNYWYGLTKRARMIVYSNERVKEGEFTTYWDLTKSKYKNKVLL